MKKILLSILCLFSIIAVRAEEVTVTFSDKGYANAQEVTAMTINDYLDAAFSQGANTNTTPKYYNLGAAYRLYAKNTMTITAKDGVIINSITMTTGSGDYVVNSGSTVSAGTLAINGSTATISGINAGSVVFTQGGTKGHVRIVSLTVDYSAPATGATLAMPETSIESGVLYNPATVELSAAAGTIHYTIDGTEPTADSPIYSEAISIDQFGTTTTIKTVAIDGDAYSDVATYEYILKVATPVMNYNTGVYEKITDLTFTTETTSATISYIRVSNWSTDVKEGGKPYGSLGVYSTGEYQAIAYVVQDGEKIWSEVVTKKFYISDIKPFKKATSIVSGTKYLINSGSIAADQIYETNTYGYLYAKNITKKGDYIETNAYYGFTFEETENAGEYYIIDEFGRYIYLKESYNSFNVDTDNTELGDAAIWTVSFDEEGNATIQNKGNNKIVQYYEDKNSFGAYDKVSYALPTLYAESEYPTFKVTPDGSESLKSFTGITITCEAGIKLQETDENSPKYTVGWNYTENWFDYGVQVDDYTVVFNTMSEITESETYHVTIPAGLFILDPNGLAIENEEGWANITVDNSEPFALVGVTPESGSVVDEMTSIMIEYNRDIFDNLYGYDIVATDENGNEAIFNISYGSDENPVPYNCLYLVAKKPIKKAGTYTLTISSEWAYCYSSNWMEMYYIEQDVPYTFTVTGNNYVEGEDDEEIVVDQAFAITSITPENGSTVDVVDTIIIEYNKDIFDELTGKDIIVTDEEGNETIFTITYGTEENPVPYNQICLVTETPITKAGTYSLTIGADWAYCYSSNWMDIYFIEENVLYTFTVTGNSTAVNEIETEEAEAVIYDITGRRIEKITVPGIYIINGVKTIVK